MSETNAPRQAIGRRIGFMQGRLSPLVDGKIQAFPWEHWREEFKLAQGLGLTLMEWTLDQDRLGENPLMTQPGRREIKELSERHGVRVGALTGDLFMQAPFWKASASLKDGLVRDLDAVLDACAEMGIREIVVPLVDNGSLASKEQSEELRRVLLARADRLREGGLVIVFESDFAPKPLAALMADYPSDCFGINYDTGNSAALGYDTREEIAAYAPRILHVHIKDRILDGTTVPLGTGNADLPLATRLIEGAGYAGDYVLQTARAQDGDHEGALDKYRTMLLDWIAEAGRA